MGHNHWSLLTNGFLTRLRFLSIANNSTGEIMRKRTIVPTLLILVFTTAAFAQTGKSRPSPAASAACDLGGGKTIKTDYSSPRMKGRKIYGDLVPFGEVWRTGANDATTFITSADVVVGGKTIPAGSYTIFIVPAADKWTLIVNKKKQERGTLYKKYVGDMCGGAGR